MCRKTARRIFYASILVQEYEKSFKGGGAFMAQMSQAGDLTSGPMLKKIILFSLPLAASSFLQLLFNAADVVVVGRFAGSAALAASDRDIILKLQEASCAGVRIDMIVRGICCVRAEVPGKTENLHIRSLVGRYLEHGRIYMPT